VNTFAQDDNFTGGERRTNNGKQDRKNRQKQVLPQSFDCVFDGGTVKLLAQDDNL